MSKCRAVFKAAKTPFNNRASLRTSLFVFTSLIYRVPTKHENIWNRWYHNFMCAGKETRRLGHLHLHWPQIRRVFVYVSHILFSMKKMTLSSGSGHVLLSVPPSLSLSVSFNYLTMWTLASCWQCRTSGRAPANHLVAGCIFVIYLNPRNQLLHDEVPGWRIWVLIFSLLFGLWHPHPPTHPSLLAFRLMD